MRSNSRRHVGTGRLLGVAATLAVVAAGTAQASTHFVIISTESTSPRTAARLNVTANPGGGSGGVTFTVFANNGNGPSISDSVLISPEFFATSESSTDPGIQNLVTGAAGQSTLVRVQTVDSSIESAVVLEQQSPEERVVLNVPALSAAQGVFFRVPIGSLHRGTLLLIGNPTSSPQAILFSYGQGPTQPPVDVAPFGVAVIPVTVANTQMRVRVADASVPVIAQLAVDTGKTTVMTFLTQPTL